MPYLWVYINMKRLNIFLLYIAVNFQFSINLPHNTGSSGSGGYGGNKGTGGGGTGGGGTRKLS